MHEVKVAKISKHTVIEGLDTVEICIYLHKSV